MSPLVTRDATVPCGDALGVLLLVFRSRLGNVRNFAVAE